MMGRLIDALELIKRFHSGKADTKEEKTMCSTVRRMIKEQPTAYDVDKVVRQLEEEREHSHADFEQYSELHGIDAEEDWFYAGLKRAIEIVKAGGVNVN